METAEDDLKWFGEGFDGFPKRLPDDCVEYSLFVIDTKIKSQKETITRLEAVRKEALKLTDRLLKEYIWQRDGFNLEINSDKGLMFLHGLTNYGDSVEDEWLIVYILKELTDRFPELWIKVVDTDGEFLLIEAANSLPRWLNPEIADNRVWIHNNSLRIVPLDELSATPSTRGATKLHSLSLAQAYEILCMRPNTLIHSPLIEGEAFFRLRDYPAQITASLHHAFITIPRKLAYILHERPASIAPATEAFYLRDPIAMKPLQSESDNLIFSPRDLICVPLRFTKVLYAQLKSQQFAPPTVWKETLTAAEKAAVSNGPKQKEYNQIKLGMKVTSGFEMLLTDPKNGDNRVVREMKILLEDLENGDLSLPTDAEIAAWNESGREDNETWLDINFEDFEKELQGGSKLSMGNRSSPAQSAFGPKPSPGFGSAKTQADLRKMVERFEAFMNDEEAGLDGAELDSMDFDDNEDDSDFDSEEEDKDVSFDEAEFTRMMREMMGMPPEDQVESSTTKSTQKTEEIDSNDEADKDEATEIREMMQRMEAELNEERALNLDPSPSKLAALKDKGDRLKNPSTRTEEPDHENDNERLSIDFNLAKNLLESFKSQAGVAGPAGNLLGLMGLQLPRDESDTVTIEKAED